MTGGDAGTSRAIQRLVEHKTALRVRADLKRGWAESKRQLDEAAKAVEARAGRADLSGFGADALDRHAVELARRTGLGKGAELRDLLDRVHRMEDQLEGRLRNGAFTSEQYNELFERYSESVKVAAAALLRRGVYPLGDTVTDTVAQFVYGRDQNLYRMKLRALEALNDGVGYGATTKDKRIAGALARRRMADSSVEHFTRKRPRTGKAVGLLGHVMYDNDFSGAATMAALAGGAADGFSRMVSFSLANPKAGMDILMSMPGAVGESLATALNPAQWARTWGRIVRGVPTQRTRLLHGRREEYGLAGIGLRALTSFGHTSLDMADQTLAPLLRTYSYHRGFRDLMNKIADGVVSGEPFRIGKRKFGISDLRRYERLGEQVRRGVPLDPAKDADLYNAVHFMATRESDLTMLRATVDHISDNAEGVFEVIPRLLHSVANAGAKMADARPGVAAARTGVGRATRAVGRELRVLGASASRIAIPYSRMVVNAANRLDDLLMTRFVYNGNFAQHFKDNLGRRAMVLAPLFYKYAYPGRDANSPSSPGLEMKRNQYNVLEAFVYKASDGSTVTVHIDEAGILGQALMTGEALVNSVRRAWYNEDGERLRDGLTDFYNFLAATGRNLPLTRALHDAFYGNMSVASFKDYASRRFLPGLGSARRLTTTLTGVLPASSADAVYGVLLGEHRLNGERDQFGTLSARPVPDGPAFWSMVGNTVHAAANPLSARSRDKVDKGIAVKLHLFNMGFLRQTADRDLMVPVVDPKTKEVTYRAVPRRLIPSDAQAEGAKFRSFPLKFPMRVDLPGDADVTLSLQSWNTAKGMLSANERDFKEVWQWAVNNYVEAKSRLAPREAAHIQATLGAELEGIKAGFGAYRRQVLESLVPVKLARDPDSSMVDYLYYLAYAPVSSMPGRGRREIRHYAGVVRDAILTARELRDPNARALVEKAAEQIGRAHLMRLLFNQIRKMANMTKGYAPEAIDHYINAVLANKDFVRRRMGGGYRAPDPDLTTE